MNPLTLKLEGVGRFASLDLAIPAGCSALVGPNGSGKSTVLNALELALFADGSRDLAPLLSPWADKLAIELTFEHAGETYRVRREYKASGRGTATLDFERQWASATTNGHGFNESTAHSAGWEPLTRESTKETQALIEATIGLSRATFNASAFLGQGNSGAFPDASPADRKAMLGSILDPSGLWPRLAERARADAKTADTGIVVARTQIAEREERLEARADLALFVADRVAAQEAAKEALTAAEGAHERARQALADNAAAAERVRTLAAQRDAAKAERERASLEYLTTGSKAASLAGANASLATAEKIAAGLADLEERDAEAQRLHREALDTAARKRAADERAANLAGKHALAEGELRRAVAAGAEVHRQLTHLDGATDGSERCDRCEQILGAEARAAAIVSLQRDVEAAAVAVHEADAAWKASADEWAAARAEVAAFILTVFTLDEDLPDALAAARKAVEERATLRERVKALEAAAAELPALEASLTVTAAALAAAEETLTEASQGVGDEGLLIRAVNVAGSEVDRLRRELEGVTADLTRAQLQAEQLAALQVETDELRASIAERQTELDTLRLAEKAFGRDGIPVLLVEAVIPQLEAEANRILDMLPTADGTAFRLELLTQREQKSVDHLKETLDVVVSDQDGRRAYETFSGGERARLNIALRIALARLLAHRRGAESRLLCIDELEFLDDLGQAGLVDVIRSVAGDFDRVLCVSHSPNVRDAFDSVIEIVKDGGVSRVAAPVLEAVAA